METVTDPTCPSEPTVDAVLERAWGFLLDERHWLQSSGFFRVDDDGFCRACIHGACAVAYVEFRGEQPDLINVVHALDAEPVAVAHRELGAVISEISSRTVWGWNDYSADHEGVMQVFETALKRRGVIGARPLTEAPA